jgi:16S rRNA processing protein RimM
MDEPERKLESVFVECNKHLVLIENSSQKTICLRMNNEEDADAIMGKIYLPLKMLQNLPVTNSTFMKLLVLKSKTIGVVGKIESINDTTAQPLLKY